MSNYKKKFKFIQPSQGAHCGKYWTLLLNNMWWKNRTQINNNTGLLLKACFFLGSYTSNQNCRTWNLKELLQRDVTVNSYYVHRDIIDQLKQSAVAIWKPILFTRNLKLWSGDDVVAFKRYKNIWAFYLHKKYSIKKKKQNSKWQNSTFIFIKFALIIPLSWDNKYK